MDTVTLVADQIDEGQRLLDRLDEEGFVVRAACWVKPVEEDRWSLYIATPAVDEKGDTLPAYRRLIPVLRSLGDGWVTSSDVTLVGEKHPIVKDAREHLRRSAYSKPAPPLRPMFGGIAVDEVYVYPLGKTKVTIYGLVFPGAPGDFGHLSLEPQDPHATLKVEDTEFRAETGRDWVIAAPEGATLEEDEIGRKVLAWDRHGRRVHSTANHVFAFADLGLHGFRILSKPA
jgi:hypothetical protein